jgi:hypothetical protein
LPNKSWLNHRIALGQADLLRHYTFSTHDFTVIRRCRGDHNRLGFAVQLCYLRFSRSRLLALDEVPYPPILGMAAAQLKVPTAYAQMGQAPDQSERSRHRSFRCDRTNRFLGNALFKALARPKKLARSADFDHLGLPGNHYSQFRRYTPTFLEAFEFKAAPATQKILDAIEVLKGLTINNSRSVPDDAPKDFIHRRWAPYVFTEAGLDRSAPMKSHRNSSKLPSMIDAKTRLRASNVREPNPPASERRLGRLTFLLKSRFSPNWQNRCIVRCNCQNAQDAPVAGCQPR